MKLRNKKTGEIGEINYHDNRIQVVDTNSPLCGNSILGDYRSLAELNEEWEDCYNTMFYLFSDGDIGIIDSNDYGDIAEPKKEIGNYFESKEEAELAVNKLKAWKRLKDAGFKFEGFKEDYLARSASQYHRIGNRYLQFNKSEDEEWLKQHKDDFDLLFGETE